MLFRSRPLREYYGYAYPDKGLIELRSGMNDTLYMGTLIHELLHILWPLESENKILTAGNTITHYLKKKGFGKRKK